MNFYSEFKNGYLRKRRCAENLFDQKLDQLRIYYKYIKVRWICTTDRALRAPEGDPQRPVKKALKI